MAAERSAAVNGLARYSSMPACKHRSRSSFRDRAVKAMTGRWPPAVRSALPDRIDDLKAVQLRHVDVEQQQVEDLAFQQGERLPPVDRHRRRESQADQQVVKEVPVELVVFGRQDAQRNAHQAFRDRWPHHGRADG